MLNQVRKAPLRCGGSKLPSATWKPLICISSWQLEMIKAIQMITIPTHVALNELLLSLALLPCVLYSNSCFVSFLKGILHLIVHHINKCLKLEQFSLTLTHLTRTSGTKQLFGEIRSKLGHTFSLKTLARSVYLSVFVCL